MLICQNSGWHQESNLFSIHYSFKSSSYGNFRLTVSNITAKQSIHRLRLFHIFFDFPDGSQLIRSFLKGKGILKFLLPYSIWPAGKPLGFFSFGIKLNQFLGYVFGCCLGFGLGFGPDSAAHLVKTRDLPLCADIFLQHSYLIRRHIQLIISAILNTQIISANPLNFHSFHAKIFANTMLVVNHIVSHIDFPEMTNAFLTAYSI